jgi:hypothetical protein
VTKVCKGGLVDKSGVLTSSEKDNGLEVVIRGLVDEIGQVGLVPKNILKKILSLKEPLRSI